MQFGTRVKLANTIEYAPPFATAFIWNVCDPLIVLNGLFTKTCHDALLAPYYKVKFGA